MNNNKAITSPLFSTLKIQFNQLAAIMLLFLFFSSPVFAITAQDVVINIDKNASINIDLGQSIDTEGSESPLSVVITTPPSNGVASLTDGTIISYTPNTDFVGQDQLTYTASDDDGSASAEIRITVGTIIDFPSEDSVEDTLEVSITDTLNEICSTPSSSNNLLVERCNELEQASDEERQAAVREIAPEEIAAQNNTADILALAQLRTVGKRLSALRRGSRGISLKNLSFTLKQQTLSVNDLAHSFFNQQDSQSSIDDFGLLSNKLGIFASGDIGFGSRDETAREDGFDYDSRGLTIGVDYRISSQLVLGVATAYNDTSLDINNDGGELAAQGISLIGYGSYYPSDKIFVDFIVSSTRSDYDATRNINYTAGGNTVDETADGDTSSQLNALSVGAGYSLIERDGWNVSTLGRIDYLNSGIDEYKETGADEFNLRIEERDFTTTIASLGVQVSYPVSQSWGVIVPQVDLSWEHELNGGSDTIKGSFVDDAEQTTFEFDTDEADDNYFRAGVGASVVLTGGINAFVLYETTFAKAYTKTNNLSFGARYELTF